MLAAALFTLGLAPAARGPARGRTVTAAAAAEQNTLILDHLNINHEKGRHDVVDAFYFDLLGCVPDQRKAKNRRKGSGTVWANLGAHQFHLSEGDEAQVFDGRITLEFDSLAVLRKKLMSGGPPALRDTAFACSPRLDGGLELTDPWGSTFVCREAPEGASAADPRGCQPGGEDSSPDGAGAIVDLEVAVPAGGDLAGIGRFYERVLGCAVLSHDAAAGRLVVSVGGRQTLTFAATERPPEDVSHEDVDVDADGAPLNRGAHISLYLADMPAAYRAAAALGVTYVNHRFKRRAFSEDEAVEQCMFRILDVVDPENVAAGPIIRLEHEVRSATQADGTKYKSCPLFDVGAEEDDDDDE